MILKHMIISISITDINNQPVNLNNGDNNNAFCSGKYTYIYILHMYMYVYVNKIPPLEKKVAATNHNSLMAPIMHCGMNKLLSELSM